MGRGQERRQPGEAWRFLRKVSLLFSSGADYLEIFDDPHSIDDDRFICIGFLHRGVVVAIKPNPRTKSFASSPLAGPPVQRKSASLST